MTQTLINKASPNGKSPSRSRSRRTWLALGLFVLGLERPSFRCSVRCSGT
jgi:hypothetical protein